VVKNRTSQENGPPPSVASAPTSGTPGWREATIVVLVAIPLAVLMLAVAPIPQDASYHALADTRAFLGIPNFANVVSNVAFLLVGVFGLRLCSRNRTGGAALSWNMFFLGAVAISVGSAYYHWAPGDSTLAWDRLPMTIVFMALFAALVSEHLRLEMEPVLLPVGLLVGIASVAWWRYTDDLRLYAWVQFAPLAIIVFLLIAYRGRYTHREYLAYGLVAYALAKAAEAGDGTIYELTAHAISGHTLKHLLAAVSLLMVYLMLSRRRPVR
jgi:hypothetical protein